jgi:chromosome partitioning protein
MSIVICIANQKGGVNKTTITRNLGHFLSLEHGPVLLIDLDAQASLTGMFGTAPQAGHMATVLGDVEVGTGDLAAIIQPITERLYIAPADIGLAQTESTLILHEDREYLLQRALAPIQDRFSYIVIDCPPSLGLLVTNALLASQWVIIPSHLDAMAIGGVALFMRNLTATQEDYPACAQLLGTVATQVDLRTVLAREMLDTLRERADLKVFTTVLPATVRFKEAALLQQSIADYDPHGSGTQAYQAFTSEVIARVNQ